MNGIFISICTGASWKCLRFLPQNNYFQLSLLFYWQSKSQEQAKEHEAAFILLEVEILIGQTIGKDVKEMSKCQKPGNEL